MDTGHHVSLLFFDLSRALYSLNTLFLVEKLDKYGFRENILRMLESFPENSQIRVKDENEVSDLTNIIIGVPQGLV